jgi:DNA-directed RNA polymerase specialized sigma24 family protein
VTVLTFPYAPCPGVVCGQLHAGVAEGLAVVARPEDEERLCAWILSLTARRARRLGLSGEEAEDCALGFVGHVLPYCRADAFRAMPAAHRRAWLIRCADNWAVSELRRLFRQAGCETPWPEVKEEETGGSYGSRLDFEAPDKAPSPEATALRAELCERVLHAFSRLRRAHQEVLQARLVGGTPLGAFARAQGRSAGSVRFAFWAARLKLREALERGGLDEREAEEYLSVLSR